MKKRTEKKNVELLQSYETKWLMDPSFIAPLCSQIYN